VARIMLIVSSNADLIRASLSSAVWSTLLSLYSGHLPSEIKFSPVLKNAFSIPDEGLNLDEVEQQLIRSALEKSSGNKTKAAQLLGITRRRLYSMMDRFGLIQ